MSTTYHYFTGIGRYAWLNKLNKFDKYSIDLVADKDTRKAIKETGIRSSFKEDEEGNMIMSFRREATKEIKGEMVNFGPPKVLNADGTEYDFKKLIGNGSKVTVKVSVYDSAQGKGSRLEAVRLDELVEYIPPARDEATTADGLPPF